MKESTRVVMTLLLTAPLGCARVNPESDFRRTAERVSGAIGTRQDVPSDEDAAAAARVDALAADGLTAGEAVEIALLNNPRIKAGFYRVGMSRADVVQAGLFTNPRIGFSFNLPEGGGANQFGMNLAQNIADLWMIPARKRAARRDLDRVILETANEVASLAFDTKAAYFNAAAAERSLQIANDNLDLVGRLHKVAQARQDAGFVGSIDVNLVRGLLLRAEVDQRNARLAAASAKRTLARLLGFSTAAEQLPLIEGLPARSDVLIDPSVMVEAARASRLDLEAARQTVAAARARVRYEYARVFQDVEVGIEVEHQAHRAAPGRKLLADTARASIANGGLTAPDIESRGQRAREKRQVIDAILGPSLAITLPLFDQNQAQIAKANYALQEASALLDSLDRSIAQQTRDAADRAATAWDVARLYEKEVLPQARTTLELSESAYQAGNTAILNVIDAQRTLLEVQQAYVAALQGAANALVDLERATARPARVLLTQPHPATRPSETQPSTQPEEVRQ